MPCSVPCRRSTRLPGGGGGHRPAIYLDLEAIADLEKLSDPVLFLDQHVDITGRSQRNTPHTHVVRGTARHHRRWSSLKPSNRPFSDPGPGVQRPAALVRRDPCRADRICQSYSPVRDGDRRPRCAATTLGARRLPGQLPSGERRRQSAHTPEFHSYLSRTRCANVRAAYPRRNLGAPLDHAGVQPKHLAQCLAARQFACGLRADCDQLYRLTRRFTPGTAAPPVSCQCQKAAGEIPQNLYPRQRIGPCAARHRDP